HHSDDRGADAHARERVSGRVAGESHGHRSRLRSVPARLPLLGPPRGARVPGIFRRASPLVLGVSTSATCATARVLSLAARARGTPTTGALLFSARPARHSKASV